MMTLERSCGVPDVQLEGLSKCHEPSRVSLSELSYSFRSYYIGKLSLSFDSVISDLAPRMTHH